jgi:hypothetical protein
MNKNKLYCVVKAERAEAKGKKKEAIRWYQEAAKESLKDCRKCGLFAKMVNALIAWG